MGKAEHLEPIAVITCPARNTAVVIAALRANSERHSVAVDVIHIRPN